MQAVVDDRFMEAEYILEVRLNEITPLRHFPGGFAEGNFVQIKKEGGVVVVKETIQYGNLVRVGA